MTSHDFTGRSPAKDHVRVEDQLIIAAHPGFAADRGDDACGGALVAGGKLAADDAGLAPDRSRLQFAILRQAGQLALVPVPHGERSGLSRTEYEAAAVGGIVIGEQLDMIDNAAVVAADPRGFQPLAHRPGVVGELWDVLRGNGERVIVDQEKPVAAPGNIADDGASAVSRGPAFSSGGPGRFTDTLPSSCNVALTSPTGVSIRCTRLDTAKPASEAISPMVPWPHIFRKPALLKKMTPAVAAAETGWHSSAPTSTSLPRGSENHRLTPAIEVTGETVAALRHAAAAEVREAVNDQAGGFAAGV